MSKLLHLKHWQLFLLITVIPMLFQIFAIEAILNNVGSSLLFAITMLFVMIIFFGWFYVLGVGLHKKLPSGVHMNLKLFKVFLIIPAFYIFLTSLFISFSFNDTSSMAENYSAFAGIIIPIHLFSIFCIFYCLYFISKELKSVEWQRPVIFSDYAGEFFLIWFFLFGLWFIQPRINKIFSENTNPENNLFHK